MSTRERGGFWVAVFAAVFYPLTWLLSRSSAKGTEQIPISGGALLVLNHPSFLDPAVDAVFVHRRGRVPRFFTKDTLWNVPVLRSVLTGAGQIPVARGTSRATDSLAAGHTALRDGKVVVIYPEGTLTANEDGVPTDTRTGVARLALGSEVPVLPAARWGTREIFDAPRRRFRPFPRKPIRLLIGPPMDLSAYRDREPDGDLYREVTDVIMARVTELLDQVRAD